MAAKAAAATTTTTAAVARDTVVLSVRHFRRKRVGRRLRPSLSADGSSLRADRRQSRLAGAVKPATADMVA